VGCGDTSTMLCSNPCKSPDFRFYSEKSKVCYNSKALADAGTGPCTTWCTNDLNFGTGCGE